MHLGLRHKLVVATLISGLAFAVTPFLTYGTSGGERPVAADADPASALADFAASLHSEGPVRTRRAIPDDEHHRALLGDGAAAGSTDESCEIAVGPHALVAGLAASGAHVSQTLAASGGSVRATPVAEGGESGCMTCHGNAGFLIGAVTPPEAPAEDGCATAPTRPPFIGYFVNADFADTTHGRLGCTTCHGGDAAATEQATAHAGMKPGHESCATCHGEIVERHETSLHHALGGMAKALEKRADTADVTTHQHLQPVWDADCASCHTECSDCHVSLPEAVGGGLIKGHEFFRRAPMEDTCALCHGSRAGGEYLGNFERIPPDLHFEAGMHCLDCHKNDLHGDGVEYENRWQVAGRAKCTDCHAALPEPAVMAHNAAHEDLSCQVCHGQPYQNCFDCHAGEEDGVYFRKAGKKELLFKLGRNTVPGYPHDIVPLRNNPVARHSFDHFGEGLLPLFDDGPTWKTAAPHNIRRVTPQNESCANCHDDQSIFLNLDDLDPDGAAANRDVLIEPKGP